MVFAVWVGLACFASGAGLGAEVADSALVPESAVDRATAGGMLTEVAVEVVEKGRSPEWIRVKVPVEAVPEPSAALLLLGPVAVFLMRRRRH